jgi:hypothetical protein
VVGGVGLGTAGAAPCAAAAHGDQPPAGGTQAGTAFLGQAVGEAITLIPRCRASSSRLLQSHHRIRTILFSSGERMPPLVSVNTGMLVFTACVPIDNMNELHVEPTNGCNCGSHAQVPRFLSSMSITPT